MAVCGWCWVCGYKFDGVPGEAVAFACDCVQPGPTEHKICRPCHDAIDNFSESESDAARDLLQVILQRRSTKNRGTSDERERLRAFVAESRRDHHAEDDAWYSCPKSPEGCTNPAMGDDCNCGADDYNARVEEMLR